MKTFSYARAVDVASAIKEVSADDTAMFIAGGTNLIDLMKENVSRPSRLVDITRLPLTRIEELPDGGLRLGALVKNADTAYNAQVERRYPILSRAILSGGSAQIRNMATNGGNPMQRTRCGYFYDTATPCNKREPGTGCSAIDGVNRMHAILGTSEQCIAVHPSDMCVALAALGAVVRVTGTRGERTVPFADFHRLPGDTPHIDNNLRIDEIITAIDLPPRGFAEHYAYLKVRDRTSYAFALVSVAAALEMEGDTVTEARLALGGVAHKPWRNTDAEAMLNGLRVTKDHFEAVAFAILRDAKGFGQNDFKIALAQRAIVRALQQAANMGEEAVTIAYIGEAVSRVDGRAKVTGQATYAGEPTVANLAYGYVVTSTVAKGTITRIDTTEALAVPGVLKVLTHENSPLPASRRTFVDEAGSPGEAFIPFRNNSVKFSQQPVALVLADTFELARYAATLVRVEYDREAHLTDLEAALGEAYDPPWRVLLPPIPKPRGDAEKALAASASRVDAEYRAPAEHHNPMELYASTAVWDDNGTLTVYDKTQGVKNVQGFLCSLFDYDDDELRVLSPYVGGGFGSGLRPQYQVFLAVLAARNLKRSVKVTLTRQQMFGLCYRPIAWQRVALGASRDGKLDALVHEAIQNTSRYEHYCESTVHWSAMLYQCDNVKVSFKLAQLDLTAPADMRAPGASWGLFALESAMDELAVELRVDPLELRRRNYAEKDQNRNVPFSSKALRDCYEQGAERIGWSRRKAEPRSTRRDGSLVGFGMASGVWVSPQLVASASAVLTLDGMLTVSSATADIGTGTYTIMTQIAAETLGLPLNRVTFKLGDSSLPKAPVEGGSFTASTVGPAVQAACMKVRDQLLGLAQRVPGSPVANRKPGDVIFDNGHIRLPQDPSQTISFADAMRHSMVNEVEGSATTGPSAKQRGFGTYSHSAVFTEVHVDEDLGTIRVARAVSALAVGRVLNPKTARNQVLGGLVWGIGMALEEESVIDQKFGRFMNHSLGEYYVPVSADIHDLDVIFVDERDDVVNPLGAKGLGEIGLVGVAAAIANAVYNATGKRIRELPITLDKLL